MEKKQNLDQKSSKKKIIWTVITIIIVLATLSFIFKNNIEASYKGVDVKYIENPQYCEVDDDCIFEEKSCSYVNKFNYKVAEVNSCFASSTSVCFKNICVGSNSIY